MKLGKRIFAVFLAVTMCMSLLTVQVFAQNKEISETAKENIISNAAKDGYFLTDEMMDAFFEEFFGVSRGNISLNLGGFWVSGEEYGEYDFITDLPDTYLTADYPGGDEGTMVDAFGAFDVCAYAAVLDTDNEGNPLPDAEVQYYYVTIDEDTKKISGTIPIGESGSAVMLFQQFQIAGKMEFEPQADFKTILENSEKQQKVEYQAKFTMSDLLSTTMSEGLVQNVINKDNNEDLHYELTIHLPEGIEIDTENYTFDSNIFRPIEFEKVSAGEWKVIFEIKIGEWDYEDGSMIFDDQLKQRLQEQMTLSFSAMIPAEYTTGNQFLVGSMLLHGWHVSDTSWLQFDYKCQSTAAIVQTVSAVTVTPADMTIYMGGDGGYEGVVGEGGSEATEQNSLPEPLFKVTTPSGVNAEPSDITFEYEDAAKTWTLEKAGEGTDLYRMKAGDGQEPVRVQFTDENGDVHVSDEFKPTEMEELFAEYDIDIYSGENDTSKVVAMVDGNAYPISSNSGKLTVRAVADTDPTQPIKEEVEGKVPVGTAVAVAPADTTYTINDLGVPVVSVDGKDPNPSLLFDNIIEDAGSTARTDALKKKANEKLGAPENGARVYEVKYLDLVDANDGNIWITASNPVNIYWGYPEGTDQNTKFEIVHFKGLHRDGSNSGYDVDDITDLNLDNVEVIVPENTENGIKFSVGSGGFSPFALTYTKQGAHTITATATAGGSITPSGSVTVEDGKDQGFTMTANDGYFLKDVLVDGNSVGKVNTYVFNAVKENHKIEAVFEKESSSSGGGSHSSNTHYVKYHNGDEIYRDGKFIPGEEVTARGNVFTAPKGMILAGWSLKEDGRVDYKIGDTFRMPSKTLDLYAVWKEGELETLTHTAYISGYPDGTVGPDRTITRAEAATMFYNLLSDKSGTARTFADVPMNQWYANAVTTLAGMGVINGYPDGTFKPDAPITRAEFVTMAMNFAKADKGTACSFADVPENMWYYSAIAGATENGWISGYPDGTFGPDRYITRAEVTSVINRMENRAADMMFIVENLNDLRTFSDLPFQHWAYGSMMEAANGHDYTREQENTYEVWTGIK
nr:S-layer homology domain-containing protein [uncultured Anaerotignum sp.]